MNIQGKPEIRLCSEVEIKSSIFSISDKICHFSLHRAILLRQRYLQKSVDLPYRCVLTFIITMAMRRMKVEFGVIQFIRIPLVSIRNWPIRSRIFCSDIPRYQVTDRI